MKKFVLQKAVTNTIRIIPQVTRRQILQQREMMTVSEKQRLFNNDNDSKNINAVKCKNRKDDQKYSDVIETNGDVRLVTHGLKLDTALDTYVRMIDTNLLEPLREDARISEDILVQASYNDIQ